MSRLPLDRGRMMRALELLDAGIGGTAHLIIGGGGAMTLAYSHPIATQDIDAFAAKGGMSVAELDAVAKKVADELDIPPDWLNSHFETFTGVLPNDYATRLRRVFDGQRLRVDALGPEDLLVMKCFAGRDKDRPHARKLIRLAQDLELVDRHLQHLVKHRYPGAERAADYFDDLRDEADL